MREMKDSGVEWIGEIPKEWDCCKQKYKITLINGRAYKDNEFEEEGKYRILRVGNLFSNPVWYSSSLELEEDKYCDNGDLIYAWSMSYGPYIWSGEKVIYHYHIWKAKITDDMDKMFAYYYYQALTESIKSETHETTMGFVTMGNMNNSYIAYPKSNVEQKRIADYLDTKCAKIDSIIEKQQAIIEKLKEYKLSVITEAVTKGLNPDAEMKDSGVECIGRIPINCKVSKLKYVVEFHNGDRGSNYPSGEDLVDEGIAFLSSNNIHGMIVDINTVETKYITKERYDILGGAKLKINDIVFCLRGSIGICAINKELTEGTIASSLVVIRPKNINHDFLNYLLHSNIVYGQSEIFMNGTCAANLSAQNLGNYYFVEHSLNAQKEIVEYLDEVCKVLDLRILNAECICKKLQEYKKSLIYEVVTGKKEV